MTNDNKSRAGTRPGEHNPSTGMGLASSRSARIRGTGQRRAWRCVCALSLFACLALSATGRLALSHADAMRIGRKVWENECGGTLAGLTSWNTGENFASLGIGHFIWYPAGERGPFEESFPKFVTYAASHGAKLPELLLGPKSRACPWNSRAEFLAAKSTRQMQELRRFLADTIDLQADFLLERLHEALPKMLAAAPAGERARIREQFERVAGTPEGIYALVDYVNFKGEGVLLSERYRGRGWGLLQVLEGMPRESTAARAADDFAASAARVLRERVKNSPPQRNENRWLPGWLSRVASYRG